MPEMSMSEGFLKIVKEANRFLEPDSSKRYCKPFLVEGKQVGWVHPDILRHLKHFPNIFNFVNCLMTGEVKHVCMNFDLNTYELRSEKIAEVLAELRKKDNLVALKGWRDEDFDVFHKYSEPPLMKMERSATSLFGVKAYGVHINGYTYHPSKGLSMWIGKRSKTKPTWPGKLDQMVAGGLTAGLSILECAKKECREEASVSEKYLQKLKPVGTVSYFYEDERGLFPETQFVYDLEVPETFEPTNTDGEVESFELIPIAKVKELIVSDEFKFNCTVVILDFLIRHSLINPDDEPYYAQLVQGIHTPLS